MAKRRAVQTCSSVQRRRLCKSARWRASCAACVLPMLVGSGGLSCSCRWRWAGFLTQAFSQSYHQTAPRVPVARPGHCCLSGVSPAVARFLQFWASAVSFVVSSVRIGCFHKTPEPWRTTQNGFKMANLPKSGKLKRNLHVTQLSVKAEWEEDAAEFLFRTPRGHVGLSRG